MVNEHDDYCLMPLTMCYTRRARIALCYIFGHSIVLMAHCPNAAVTAGLHCSHHFHRHFHQQYNQAHAVNKQWRIGNYPQPKTIRVHSICNSFSFACKSLCHKSHKIENFAVAQRFVHAYGSRTQCITLRYVAPHVMCIVHMCIWGTTTIRLCSMHVVSIRYTLQREREITDYLIVVVIYIYVRKWECKSSANTMRKSNINSGHSIFYIMSRPYIHI